MANLALSVAPGYYLEAQNASWVLGADVDFVSFTKDGPSPAISKYIAYDTLTPPNPFIAVTQDGNGNVVYDGGFPKFYNNVAPPAGIDSLFSMEYKGTRTAGATGNTYYYDAFTDLQVTIAPGDRLVYDMLMDSADARVGIDAITANLPTGLGGPYNYSLRDWGAQMSVIKDQNGLSVHPATDLGGRGVGSWYHREFDLSAAAGATFIKWSLAYEGEIPGTFYTRFKEVYILNSSGKVKATLFKDSIKLPNSTSTEAGASGYTGTAKYIYDPRASLSASFKYLFNAIRWVANPAKAKKILVLGDTTTAGQYSAKGTGASSFATSMQRISSACGYTCDIKDVSDYPNGKLGCTLAELNGYALVIMISTAYEANNAELITPGAVTDLITYRQQGGGLIFITDHGSNPITSVDQVATAAGVGFYATANRVIANFGTFFTGNYDRTPVNVGFLRANYGDHPLYSGMLDSENIAAGGSESKVILATFDKYTSANIPNVSIANNGVNSIKAIAMLKNGTIEIYNFVYVIATGQLLKVTDGNGVEINSFPASFANTRQFNVEVLGSGLGTIVGDILLNTTKVGELSYSDTLGSVQAFYAGDSQFIPVKKNDVFHLRITSPFSFSRDFPVNRLAADIPQTFSLPAAIKAVKAGGFTATPENQVLVAAIAQMNQDYSHLGFVVTPDSTRNLSRLRSYYAGVLDLSTQAAFVYATTAAANEAMGRLVPPSQATVFNTWDRFANNDFFPKGVGATGEAAAWVWDNAKQAAVMPLNTAAWVGFVSPDATDTYEIDVVIKSDNADDDVNGLVLAFNRVGNINNRLSVQLHQGGLGPAASHSITIAGSTSATLVLNDFAGRKSNVAFPSDGGWRGKFSRVKVTRKGDNFKVLSSQWNSLLLDPASLMEVTLDSSPAQSQFKGAKPWGFLNSSQPASYFTLNSFKGGTLYDIVVDVSTNKVYRYSNGGWAVLPGLKAQDVFGAPRTLTNSETGKSFKLNADGTITAL